MTYKKLEHRVLGREPPFLYIVKAEIPFFQKWVFLLAPIKTGSFQQPKNTIFKK